MSDSEQSEAEQTEAPARRSPVKSAILGLLASLVLVPLGLWSAFALHFSNLPGAGLRTALAWIFGLGFLLAYIAVQNRKRTALIQLGAFLVIAIWWGFIPASNDRDWMPELARVPHVDINGDVITVHDIRNFDYRSETDFTERWETRNFKLSELETIDFMKSHWDGNTQIAHILLSFVFKGGKYLTLSCETRREKGEIQTGLRGFFKQYEIAYCFADEADVVRLRTNFRNEKVYLYPTTTTPEEARKVLDDVIKRVNELYVEPDYYNTIVHNCMTGPLRHFKVIGRPKTYFDMRLLKNGLSDQMAYEGGWIRPDLPFKEMRERSHINPYVKDHPQAEGFSRRIRPWLK